MARIVKNESTLTIDKVAEVEGRLDAGLTPTSGWYSDEDVHRLELERVFGRNWQLVGTTADVEKPGSYFTTQIDEFREFMVVRGQDGSLRAFANVCPHRATQLLEGSGSVRNIQCPYHGWTFGLEGSLKGVPGLEDSDLDVAGVCLNRASVDVWEPFVFLNPDPQALPLSAHLGEVPRLVAELGIDMPDVARQRNVKVVDAILECNWKVAVENSLECYHCPTSHPGFRETVDLPRWQISVRGNCIVQGTHLRPPERRRSGRGAGTASDSFVMGPVATELAFSERGMDIAWFHWLYPNNSVSVWPGPENSFNVARWIPLGPNRTRWWSVRWWPQNVDERARDEQWDFIVQVGWEDKKIVEGIQRGIRSGLWSGGPFKIDRVNPDARGLDTSRDERGPMQFNKLIARELLQ